MCRCRRLLFLKSFDSSPVLGDSAEAIVAIRGRVGESEITDFRFRSLVRMSSRGGGEGEVDCLLR